VALKAFAKGSGTGGGGLSGLAKLQAAQRSAINTVKVKQVFVPPKAPPPPTLWAMIKNEHLLVATFWSADDNYAKVVKGSSQLRETQLVQIVFNTLMFQLGALVILAWRFTDLETGLNAGQIVAAGTIAGFASALVTLLCKGIFRWGNIHRRKLRKGSRLGRFSRWLRAAAKEEGGVREAIMKAWWSHRTATLKRTPKKGLSKMAVVLRQNFSWFLIAFIFFASFAAAVVFGIHFEDPKYATVMISWGVTLMWTWLLIEPLVIFVTFIVPRLVDEAMTPAGAKTEHDKPKRIGRPTLTLHGPSFFLRQVHMNLTQKGSSKYTVK